MEERLKSLHEKSDLRELKAYVQNLSVENICTELNRVCLEEDGSLTLQILFKGFSNTNACQNVRAKIIAELLSNFRKKTIPFRLIQKLITTLVSEVEYLTTSHLVTFINNCLLINQKNVTDEDEYVWWVDLLPQLLIAISDRSVVEHNGAIITGNEFKSHVINTILLSEWKGNMVSSVASMFNEIPVQADEHLMVINKLCKSLKTLKPHEIPPLVHQLLQLTKEQHSIQFFISLGELFDEKLYSHFDEAEASTSKMILEDDLPLKEFQMVEGTVLYHIQTAATILSPRSVKDFVKWLKESLNNPQLILRPFFLTLLLNFSQISSSFEEEILSLLTSAISKSVAEKGKFFKSSWLKSVVSSEVDVESLLNKVIQNCSRDRDRILKGLVDLGFACLALKSKIKEKQNDSVWNIGTNLLVHLVSKYSHVTSEVFHNLVNEISQEHESARYTDCLRKVGNKRPLILLDNTATIMQLLANVCTRLSSPVGRRVMIAILPLTKLSPAFRDSFIIFLRKALFSNQSCREMAVFGFLELLKHLKITDMRSLSQSVSQNYVGITQIYSGTYDSTAGVVSNEGLCLEILTILKQVFDYHRRAKIMLYKGVYDTFYINRKLGVHILENLKSHIDEFYKEGEMPPLNFTQSTTRRDSSAAQEPLAHLLLGMSRIIAKSEHDSRERSKFKELLDSITGGMIESDIQHFNLEEESPEGTTDHEFISGKIHEILGVYEALMGYILCTWTPDSLESAGKLNDLFRGYSKCSDFAKGQGKTIKRKNDDKKGTQGTQKKEANSLKGKKPQISPPSHTVLDLKCCCRLMTVLHGVTVDWATDRNTEPVRNKRDIHRYAFNVAHQLILDSRNLSREELASSRYITRYVFYIGKVLYERCLTRLSEVKEFDIQCAIMAVDCFCEVLNFVNVHFRKKVSNFFGEIGVDGNDLYDQIKSVLDLMLDCMDNLLEEAEEEMSEEGKDAMQLKKLCVNLLALCSLLIDHLPKDKSHSLQVFQKIRSMCKGKKVQNVNVAKSLLSLLLNTYTKTSVHDALVLNLVLCLCDTMTLIDDEMEIEEHEKFALINEKTASACLLVISDILRQSTNDIEWTLARCKAEIMASQYFIEESLESKRETFVEKEKRICRRLNFNIKVLSMICTIAVPPGALADAVLKEVANLYNKLVLTIKYFLFKFTKFRETFESSGLTKTIKMADHELSKNMYCFTEHIIADGSASTDEPPLKKHKSDATALKNKVLKETKMIPKVIYEKESFQKFVLQLSNKTKIEVEMKNSMARDYRLYAKQVKEIIDKENEYMEQIVMDGEDLSDNEQTQASKRMKTEE